MKIAAVSIALTLAATAGLAGCDKNAAADTKVDKAAIAVQVKNDAHDMITAFNAKDAEKAVSHDAPDYVFMVHGNPNVVGAKDDLESTREMVKDPLIWVTLGNETVDVANSGDMAVYRTTYNMRMTDPKTKKETHEFGNWVVGYQKQSDGTWKIAWNVISDTGAPAAAKPAEKKS